MSNTTLITGVTGFVGSHLLNHLAETDTELYGTIRETSSFKKCKQNIDSINFITCDLVDAPAVFDLIEDVQPDHIYHLAGQSSVESSWNSTHSLVNNNIIATINILEALKNYKMTDTRILLACSSEEYGIVSSNSLPIKETTPLSPISPYGVTKASVDMFGFQYYESHGIKTIRTRAFNHTGPRRPDNYALSSFAKQIVKIEKNKSDTDAIRVGNLNAVRDYTDVRDIIRAYELAMIECSPGEAYNVCSSTGYSIRHLLERLIELSGNDIPIVKDQSRMRPADIPKVIGDYTKFRNATNWEASYGIDDTLFDLLNYWRDELTE